MMWVRFPNGQVVQYNTANFLTYSTLRWELYTKEGGQWIASIQVSSGAIIEAVKACSVNNPINAMTPENAMNLIEENSKIFSHWQLKRLRDKLKKYNFKTMTWSS